MTPSKRLLLWNKPFEPKDLPNLWGWWDASNIASLTPDAACLFASASSQYLEATGNSTLWAVDFSIAGWVKFTTLSGTPTLLTDGSLSATPYVAGQYNYRLRYNSPNLEYLVNASDSTNTQTVTVTAPATGEWTHLAFTYAQATGVITPYINGAAGTPATLTKVAPTAIVSPKTRMGADLNSTPANFLNAAMSEWGFWSAVLSAAQVAQLYNGGSGIEYADLPSALTASLTNYWKLNEADGTRVDTPGTSDFSTLGGVPTSTTGIPASYPSDGDPVNAWNDLSGNARHLSQATSSKRAIYKVAVQNGLAGVLPDGTDDVYTIANAGSGLTPFTAFAVCQVTAGAQARALAAGSAAGAIMFGYEFSEKLLINLAATAIVLGSTIIGASTAFRGTWQYESGSSSAIIRYNGVDETQAVTPATVTSATDQIFARGASANAYPNYLHELLIYNRLLSVAEMVQVEAYLRAKWGTS